MKEVGFNAKLLRDQAGNNMEFYTNSITLGGGESLDVLLDASDAGCGSTGCAATLYPAGQHLLPLHPQSRPSFQRSGEFRWTHDRGSHLQQRDRRQHIRQHLQLGERQ